MKRVGWTDAATDDLQAIKRYFSDNYHPDAGQKAVATLVSAAYWLLEHPHAGSPLGYKQWRKWKPRGQRYVLIYRPFQEGIIVVRIRQGSNDWRPLPE